MFSFSKADRICQRSTGLLGISMIPSVVPPCGMVKVAAFLASSLTHSLTRCNDSEFFPDHAVGFVERIYFAARQFLPLGMFNWFSISGKHISSSAKVSSINRAASARSSTTQSGATVPSRSSWRP